MGKNVYTVSESENGLRLDNFLKDRSGLSRAEVQKWIKEGGAILSPDKMIRPNYHVRTGDEIFFTWEEKKELEIIPQDIPIDILYEDDDMMVINKARGMVIHPGSGNPDHTLVNALLYHCGPKLLKHARIRFVRASFTVWTRIRPVSWSWPSLPGHFLSSRRKLLRMKRRESTWRSSMDKWKEMQASSVSLLEEAQRTA